MAKRLLFQALLAAAITVPGSAGHAADAEADAPVAATFAASFAEHEALPPTPTARDGAVDIAQVEPRAEPAASLGRGVASYYADKFNGRRTASGETFRNSDLTAAHRSLPFGTRLRLTNASTGASVVVRVNDRGPFHPGRAIDVSRAAANQLGLVARGHGPVEIERLD